MTNAEISQIFLDIAEMLKLKKDNIFKIRAYERAARAIAELEVDVGQLVAEDKLKEIPGVGEAINRKVIELVNTGKLDFYQRLKAEFPERAGSGQGKTVK